MLSSMLERVVGGCNSRSDKYPECCIHRCIGEREIVKLIAIRPSRRASWAEKHFPFVDAKRPFNLSEKNRGYRLLAGIFKKQPERRKKRRSGPYEKFNACSAISLLGATLNK